MESGLQFWRMRRAVLAHSTTQTMQQFDEIFTEMKLEQSCCLAAGQKKSRARNWYEEYIEDIQRF